MGVVLAVASPEAPVAAAGRIGTASVRVMTRPRPHARLPVLVVTALHRLAELVEAGEPQVLGGRRGVFVPSIRCTTSRAVPSGARAGRRSRLYPWLRERSPRHEAGV